MFAIRVGFQVSSTVDRDGPRVERTGRTDARTVRDLGIRNSRVDLSEYVPEDGGGGARQWARRPSPAWKRRRERGSVVSPRWGPVGALPLSREVRPLQGGGRATNR